MDVTFDREKLKQLILYVAAKLIDDRAGGATKLNKVLFFADFAHVRLHGRPITGAEYQKLEHGPAPRVLRPLREELVCAGAAVVERASFLGYTYHRLVPMQPAELARFTATEIAVVDEVLADLAGLTARQVSDLSHEELGWQLVGYGDTIPYETAGLRRPMLTPAIQVHGERVAKELADLAS